MLTWARVSRQNNFSRYCTTMSEIVQIEIDREGVGGNIDLPATPPSKQSTQHKCWFFTWNNYLESDIEPLRICFNALCEWYVFQEEKGKVGLTPHLQGVLMLKKRARRTELSKIDKSIIWFVTKAEIDSIKYCSKLDTRNGRIFNLNCVVPEPIRICEPYGWQLEILDIIKEPPHERQINWYWEPTGRVGKSALTKYMFIKHQALKLSGKSADMFNLLADAIDRKIIIVDIPKDSQDYINYSAIEEIKNGLICSGKYKGKMFAFNTPHIFVFANIPPKYGALSLDRWNVVRIGGAQPGDPVSEGAPKLYRVDSCDSLDELEY